MTATITSPPSSTPAEPASGPDEGARRPPAGPVPPPPDSAPPPRRRRLRRFRRVLAVVLVVALVPAGWSYAHALTAPGGQGWKVQSVEWLRDHGLNGVVNGVEDAWLKLHPPHGGGRPKVVPHDPGRIADLPRVRTPAATALPGEGVWHVAPAAPNGTAGLATTFVRPDATHTSYVVGLARLDPKLVRFRLVAGTVQPGGGGWPWGGQVPPTERSNLVAVFNSGFKMRDAHGGYWAEGRTAKPLVPGDASLVVTADGRIRVVQWGREISTTDGLAAVRQNLHLIVDRGQVVPGLSSNAGQQWGGQLTDTYTWRSAIGVDRAGNVIYAGGDGMTLESLAQTMHRAGAVEAMELDIHNHMVTFNYFEHPPRGLRGAKLTPSMPQSAFRYLSTDQRDFVAVLSR